MSKTNAASAVKVEKKIKKTPMKRLDKIFLFMAVPGVLFFFLFHTYPALQSFFYSFTNWRGYGKFEFVGIKNYFLVLTDTRALDAYFFTFRFAIITTIIVNALSLILALALNSKIRFRNFFKAVFFFPNILSILIVSYIFKYIFTYLFPQAASALASSGLITAEIGNVLSKSILGNSSLAWLGVVFVQAWQAIALNTVLYLAGLQTVSEELYEVADIDGASGWQKFRHITFPLIAPFFTINMVLALKNFLMVFDSIMGLTSGGPGRATESISVLIYNGGFLAGEFAYQSANAIIYFLVIASISFIQLRFLNRREEKIYEK